MNNSSFNKLNKIIVPALFDTLSMVFITTVLALFFGFIIATLLYITSEKGLKPNKVVNGLVSSLINVVRSFPFIILVVALTPLTRMIVGTVIGNTAALVPLVISCTAMMTRLIESAFREVDLEIVEAAKSFGATNLQIMTKVVLVEAVPAIVSGVTVAIIAILGSTAAAGAVGAKGLGSIAINYGYASFDDTIMYFTVFVLIIVVQFIQMVGNITHKRVKK